MNYYDTGLSNNNAIVTKRAIRQKRIYIQGNKYAGVSDKWRMVMTVALLGSWAVEWITDHLRWLNEFGPHRDGCKNAIGEKKRKLIKQTINYQKYIDFYAYMAKTRGGDGNISYRLRCRDLEFLPEQTLFQHQYGSHKITFYITFVFVFKLRALKN